MFVQDLSPDQLQKGLLFLLLIRHGELFFLLDNLIKILTVHVLALRKTFSAEKKKSKIRKAWDGTKVIYNVASWGATAVG
jgi:hypothetical protein